MGTFTNFVNERKIMEIQEYSKYVHWKDWINDPVNATKISKMIKNKLAFHTAMTKYRKVLEDSKAVLKTPWGIFVHQELIADAILKEAIRSSSDSLGNNETAGYAAHESPMPTKSSPQIHDGLSQ